MSYVSYANAQTIMKCTAGMPLGFTGRPAWYLHTLFGSRIVNKVSPYTQGSLSPAGEKVLRAEPRRPCQYSYHHDIGFVGGALVTLDGGQDVRWGGTCGPTETRRERRPELVCWPPVGS